MDALNSIDSQRTDFLRGLGSRNAEASVSKDSSADFKNVLRDNSKNSTTNFENSKNSQPNSTEAKNYSAPRTPVRPERPSVPKPIGGTERANIGSEPVSAPAASDPLAKLSESEEVAPAMMEGPASGEELNHRSAMLSFLKRMREELGLDPSDILASFAALSTQDLILPPQQNIDKMVAALPIAPEQRGLAKEILSQMMSATQGEKTSDYLKSGDRQLSLMLMTRQELAKRQMSRSLDEMNQRFFMNGPNKTKMESSPEVVAASTKGVDPLANVVSDAIAPVRGDSSLVAPAQNAGPVNSMSNQEIPLDAEFESYQDLNIQSFSEESAPATKPLPTVDRLSPVDWDKVQQGETAKDSLGETSAKTELGAPSEAGLVAKANPGTEAMPQETGDESGDNSQRKSDDQSGLRASGPEFKVEQGTSASRATKSEVGGMFASTQLTEADRSKNVNEVATRAESLVKKGGGEMKIALNPEGLGQMTMKVAVKNGQVAVEMVTETHEAKRMLEKGLADLKTSLAAHQLNVDNIKVDTSADISKNLNNQHNQENGRQLAQQFMEQFRQGNQEWRQGLFDIQGARAYRSQTRDRSDNDAVTAAALSAKAKEKGRLNLVA